MFIMGNIGELTRQLDSYIFKMFLKPTLTVTNILLLLLLLLLLLIIIIGQILFHNAIYLNGLE